MQRLEAGNRGAYLKMRNIRQITGLTRKQAHRLEAVAEARELYIIDEISLQLIKMGLLYDQGVSCPEIRVTDHGLKVLDDVRRYNEQRPVRLRYSLSEQMVVALRTLATHGYLNAETGDMQKPGTDHNLV